MAQSILVFDFGTNEDAVQQAKRKVEGWKQGFRLGDKMVLKFEREESAEAENEDEAEKSAAKGKKKAAAKKDAAGNSRVKLLLKLAFSDHEKISQQRWLDRVPTEEPFKSVDGETLREGDAGFAQASERFDSLD